MDNVIMQDLTPWLCMTPWLCSQIALAVTGIAGPGGGNPEKPVGTVCFAWVHHDGTIQVISHRFQGNRATIRHQSVRVALEGILEILRNVISDNV